MKCLLFLLLTMLPISAAAQIQFGYLSYRQVMEEMPEYAKVRQDMQELKTKYETEATRGEDEFQKKFVDFLQGQKDFPQSIMQKRQAELQSLMDNGVAFRQKSQELLAQAEKDMLKEVEKKLKTAILEVGVAFGYGFILNTDNDNCPYINPVVGVDVTDLVRQKLGLIEATPAAATPENLEKQPTPVKEEVTPITPIETTPQ